MTVRRHDGTRQDKKKSDAGRKDGNEQGKPWATVVLTHRVTESWAGVYRAGRCGRLEMEKGKRRGEGGKTRAARCGADGRSTDRICSLRQMRSLLGVPFVAPVQSFDRAAIESQLRLHPTNSW